jgi:hypothetical protein
MLRAEDRNSTHNGGLSMRKLVASELMSLDGVVEAPEEWQLPYFNDQMGEEHRAPRL